MWLNLSAAQGNQEARNVRDTLAREMSDVQITEAHRMAREWSSRSVQ